MTKILNKNIQKFISVLMALSLIFSVVSFSGISVSAASVKAIKITSVKAKSKTSVTIKWKKVSGVKGYVIYQKKSGGSYKKIATVKGGSKVSYTKKSLKSGTKYYYKIKTYKVVKGKKVYSSYSSAKSVKTLKSSSGGTKVWIPTKGGTKYHKSSSCSNMIKPSKVTISKAKSLGFSACKRCYG